MNAPIEELRQYQEQHKEEMISFWKDLVNHQAGSHEIEKVNGVMQWLKDHFDEEQISCHLVENPGGPYVLVAELNSDVSEKPLLLSGHCDTVFPSGSYPEEAFTIDKEGFAHGPGVVDMKGGVADAFFVMKALKEFGFHERPVKLVLVGDEEISHVPGRADKILMEEARGALACFNMESGRLDHCLTVGRKGGMDCHITVHGVAAHAGNDYLKGRNAIIEMSHKLPLIQGLTRYEEGLTVSVGTIKGGMVSNAVPDYCYAELDVRYKKLEHMDEIQKEIRAICEKTFIEGTTTEVEFVAPMPAFEETEANHELLAFINEAATQCGFKPFQPIYVGGMSDASYISSVGVPTVCSMGAAGSGAHTKEEKASVQSFLDRWLIVTVAAMEANKFAGK